MSRKIRTEVEQVRKAATYESNCNAYTLIRKPNTAPVSVNGYPLEEGESKTYGGNIGDLYVQGLKVEFGSPGDKLLYIDRRFEE